MNKVPEEDRVYIASMAERLDRRMGTIRMWERKCLLPDELIPKRGFRNMRYWTEAQVQQLLDWMRENEMRIGKGLPHYHPNDEQIAKTIQKLRGPRGSSTSE